MDAFTTKVRTFDAFPKVDNEHTVRSVRGALSTIMTYFFGLVVLWIEVGGFLGGYVDHQFIVDDQVQTDLLINVDMIVAMPCKYIHTNVVDITDDRVLASERLNFQGSNFFVPPMFRVNSPIHDTETPELDHVLRENLRAEFNVEGQRFNDQEGTACHIFGSIPVNQVSGDFHITAKGIGYRDREITPMESLNFSHVIQEFSYGNFYPLIDNPLDFTAEVTEHRTQAYKYYTKVVPTRYQKLGIVMDTNQYSLTEQHQVFDPNQQGPARQVPGIYFRYEFEPIKLVIEEKRLPFIQFVAKLGTILGGLLIVASYVFKLYEKILTLLYGRKYVERETEKASNILDSAPMVDKDN